MSIDPIFDADLNLLAPPQKVGVECGNCGGNVRQALMRSRLRKAEDAPKDALNFA